MCQHQQNQQGLTRVGKQLSGCSLQEGVSCTTFKVGSPRIVLGIKGEGARTTSAES